MKNTLLLRYDADALDWRWIRSDAEGHSASGVRRGTLSEAASESTGSRVVVLIPGTDCLLAEVRLPASSRQKLLRAVPYAMEEQLSDEVENLHFALGPGLSGGIYPVAVVDTDTMNLMTTQLKEAGLDVQLVVSDVLALPYSDGRITVLINEDMALVRHGPYAGYAIEADVLPIALAATIDETGIPEDAIDMLLASGAEIPDLAVAMGKVQVKAIEDDLMTVFAAGITTSHINLLQGVFGRTQEWGRLWIQWRATAALLLAGILISSFVTGVETYRLGQESERLNEEITRIYKETFPEARRIVNARAQMEQQITQLERQLGGQSSGFMMLLARSGDVLRQTQGVEIMATNYRAGRLDIDLTASSVQMLDSLKQAIMKGGGISVEIQSATADAGQKVKGRLRIEGAGA